MKIPSNNLAEKAREIGRKRPDVAECTYTICLHNATAAVVARLEDDLHSTMVRVDYVFGFHRIGKP